MNRVEFVATLAEKHGLSKAEASRVLDTFLETIVNTVKKGGTVSLVGFGSFKQVTRAARTGINPQAGTKIKIAAAKVPKFTPGAAFKASVDPKFAKRKAEKAATLAKKAVRKPAAKKAAGRARKAA